MRWLFALLIALAANPALAAKLSVDGTRFVVTTDDGRRLASEQLVGAVFDMVTPEGVLAKVRIDGVSTAAEARTIVLHNLKTPDAHGAWQPLCDADAQGRRAAFPMAGRWDGQKFRAERGQWFLTCTSGSQAKCLLWGFDPWQNGPDGRSLAPLYQACQHLVRGDYDGRGTAHTRDGTTVDIWDIYDVQKPDSMGDPAFAFEAGWGPDGAVCVAKTRWADLLPLGVLLASAPHLHAQPCDEAEARRRGAVLFNRSKIAP